MPRLPGGADRAAHDYTHLTSMKSARAQVVLLALMAFLMMFVRVVFSPLLVEIQTDLSIGPAQASRFFLMMSIGYTTSVLLSGFIAARIANRGTILLGGIFWTAGLVTIAFAGGPTLMNGAFLAIGAGAGMYPPSGVAAVSHLTAPAIRPRAIALHEVGPSSAFVVAPLAAGAGLMLGGWRSAVWLVAAVSASIVLLFWRRGRTGRFAGEPPHFANVRSVIADGRFWAIMVFFTMAASSTIGVYSILPTYLVTGHGVPLPFVNRLMAASRFTSLGMLLVAGLLIQRIGVARFIGAIMVVTGALTLLLGTTADRLLLAVVFFQPVIVTGFFPAALTAISNLGAPELRNVSMSVMVPLVNLIASGLYPTLMGTLIERGRVDAGFLWSGVLIAASVVLIPLLWNRRPAHLSLEDGGT